VFTGYSVGNGADHRPNVTVSNNIVQSSARGNNFGIELRHAKNAPSKQPNIGDATQPADRYRPAHAGIKDIFFDSTGTQILANDIADASCGIQTNSGWCRNYVHNSPVRQRHVNASYPARRAER